MNVLGLIADRTALRPDATALLAPGRPPASYPQILAHLRRTASAVQATGLPPRSRVAIVTPNGPEMATAFLAVAAVAAAAPLNPAYREQEFAFYLADLAPRLVIVSRGSDSPVVGVARGMGIPILEMAVPAGAPAGCFELESAGRPGAGADEPALAAADDVALVLHTSGTTARPKMVPLTHRNLARSAGNIAASLALAPADRCLNVLPLFHIHGLVAVVLASLSAGASVVATPGFHAARFFDWLGEFAPTWYSAVPTMHQAILGRAGAHEAVIRRRPLRFVRSSSAPLPPRVLAELETVFRTPVIEAYGMTEAAHQMASNPLPPGERKPGSVGRAAGPSVAIMDEAGTLLAAGATGEVVVRGENVTAGYEGRPEANAEAFTNDWFRTGDRGYLDADGYLFLTGRLKEIINRGGEKISPREIDDVLADHPAVAEVVTFAIPDPALGEEIGAAVVLREGSRATQSELLAFASLRLADFKLPRRVVFLDDLPKGPTGKLQRVGLAQRLGILPVEPAPAAAAGPPRTDTERSVAQLYQRILEIGVVGAGDGFFALGGDSLRAVELLAAVEEGLGVAIPIFVLFEHPTVEALAKVIDEERKTGPAPQPRIVHTVGSEGVLSPAQELLWMHEALIRDTPINHRPGALRLTGRLSVPALEAALREVVRRHRVLRTVFEVQGGRPFAVILPETAVALPLEDLSALKGQERERRLQELATAHASRRFDLAHGPLFRAMLAKLADDDYVLLLNAHHIVFDGWSMSVLTAELAPLYAACQAGKPSPLKESPLQYADFAAWQRARLDGSGFERQLGYWKQLLGGDVPVLELPADRPRPPHPTGRGGEVTLLLPPALDARLQVLGREEGATLFMTLIAGFVALLHRITARGDVVIGTISAGRVSRDVSGLIGLFMNELVFRVDLSGDPAFRELLARVRKTVLGALANQDVPFAQLARTLRPRSRVLRRPFFDVVFQLRNIPEASAEGGGVRFDEMSFDWGLARFDLLVEASRRDERLSVRFEYDTDLFDRSTIERWSAEYQAVLEAASA